MRALAAAWPEGLSDRMRDLPWGHVATIATKATDARDWYAERAAAWSQDQLEPAIASRRDRTVHARPWRGLLLAGRQRSLQVGGEEVILDLLFYHHPTRRFVVIDLQVGPFRAEFAGKMNL